MGQQNVKRRFRCDWNVNFQPEVIPSLAAKSPSTDNVIDGCAQRRVGFLYVSPQLPYDTDFQKAPSELFKYK